MHSFPPDIDQNNLYDQWALVDKAYVACQERCHKDPILHLPLFPEGGICWGLSHAHAYYHQAGQGDLFYELLEIIGGVSASQIAEAIDTNTSPYVGKLLKLVSMVKSLQENYGRLLGIEKNIGIKKINAHVKMIQNRNDVTPLLQQLGQNESVEISFQLHSITVYKDLDQNYVVYDPNFTQKKIPQKSPNDAAALVINAMGSEYFASLVTESSTFRIDRKVLGLLGYGLINLSVIKSLPAPIPAAFIHLMPKSQLIDDKKHSVKCADLSTPQSTYSRLINIFGKDWYYRNGESLASLCLREGDLYSLNLLIRKYQLNPNKDWSLYGGERNEKINALRLAIEKKHYKIIKYLITKAGARIDGDGKNIPPLHYAAMGGDPDTIELLLQCGANPDISYAGEIPLFTSIRSGNIETAVLLYRAMKDKTLWFTQEINELDKDYLLQFYDRLLEEKADAAYVFGECSSRPKSCVGLAHFF